MESKKEEGKEDNISKLLILYDEFQFSYEIAKQKIESIFNAIESYNNKNDKNARNFYLKKDNSLIHLENKYYTCDISYEINSFSKIDEIDLSKYEGILLLFEETSIKNKIFMDKSHHFKEEYNFSSCIIIFEEEQEDLQNLDLFDQFIGQTIDKHFEVIYDCQNFKNFNQDDGIGAFNLSLHSTHWKSSKGIKKEEKEKNIDKKLSDENNEEKNDEKKFYKKLNDEEEIEKVFGKIKEIKKLNMDPNISLEDRRNNAEKAVMMLVNMLNLEGEDDEEEKELNEDETEDINKKKKNNNI